MSSNELTISVASLGKRYEIYARPADRLKQMVLPRLAKLARREAATYFEEFWALRGIDLTIRRGETVGIVGRNGSGKSTLLQMICGTLYPTEGVIRTYGRIAALLELGAGFNPEFTGQENIFLSGLLYGLTEAQVRERVGSIIRFAEIGDFIHQPVKTYSSGMYVRLAFSIAAHVDADTLVIDEALSVGDVRFTQKCMRYLREFQKRGTLLFVSHDTSAVTSLCTRAIWIDQGRLVMDGPTSEVVERYLAEQHAADRASEGTAIVVRNVPVQANTSVPTPVTSVPHDVIDARAPDLRHQGCNRLEIFEFDPDRVERDFGAGQASIVAVSLANQSGGQCLLSHGGEAVTLVIEALASGAFVSPIFGFYLKDRLGQRLFGDNSYITYRDRPITVSPGDRLQARFTFRMPILPNGDYSIDVALASGSQDNHTQQHWIHDALTFKASESTMRHGLVGIPMHSIEIEQIGQH